MRDDGHRDEDIFPDSPHHLLGLGEEDAANIGHQEAEQEAGREGPQQQAAHPELWRAGSSLVKKTEELLQKTTSSPCVVFHRTTEDEQPGYRVMPARLQMSSRLHQTANKC